MTGNWKDSDMEFDGLVDDDSDGVPNDWDKCPETAEDIPTDSEGCEVDLKEAAEESGLPGFGIVTALLAISMAVISVRRKRF